MAAGNMQCVHDLVAEATPGDEAPPFTVSTLFMQI